MKLKKQTTKRISSLHFCIDKRETFQVDVVGCAVALTLKI